ncbi:MULTISPECIES: acyltransferase [unclassified Providencia]|uniref:acyltransferase n=1 Tax=unclassified Providencia TaxID=2633465 RepID=UPI00234A561C|nr:MULTISPECIES: acyltransferase [unclassified Providencia]HBK4773418.1 acyltransferase [Providencia rettgeri]
MKPFLGKIGKYSYIGKPIFLLGLKNLYLGNKIRIYPNSRIEVYKYGILNIKDNVSIGQSFHVICSNRVTISTGTLISANVFITDTDHTYNNIDLPVHEQPTTCKETYIGENCFIGYGVVIQAGTKLGKNCIIGANSTVKGIFPDGSIIVGSPGRIIKTR